MSDVSEGNVICGKFALNVTKSRSTSTCAAHAPTSKSRRTRSARQFHLASPTDAKTKLAAGGESLSSPTGLPHRYRA